MSTIKWEIKDSVAVVSVDRPHVLNALNSESLQALYIFLEEKAVQEKLKVVILTGSGDRAFISGADLKEMQTFQDQHQMRQFCLLGQKAANALEEAPFVTIAAVNGLALGGGFEMALACDFIYASQQAVFGLPEVTLGLIPGFGGTQRLTRAIGSRLAKELIFKGNTISAQQALEWRVVNKMCEPNRLISDCLEASQQIIRHSFYAILQAKQAINDMQIMGKSTGFEMEREMCAACFDSHDSKERRKAFLSKKPKS